MKIGISIPTYNRSEHLESLLSSLGDNFFVYVSDNAGFTEKKIFERFPDAHVISSDVVIPIYENWNRSIEINDCDYIAMTSDDDLYVEGAFDVINKYLNEYSPDVAIFGHYFIDGNDNIIDKYTPKENIFLKAPEGFSEFKFDVSARTPSIFYKRSFLDKIGLLDCNFKVTAADSELIQRALLVGSVLFVPDVVSKYRVWESNTTHNNIATSKWLEEIDLWTRKIIEFGKEKSNLFSEGFSKKYSDEIYARNLYAGMANLFNQNKYRELLLFKKEARWPSNALVKTRLRIVWLLLKSRLLAYVG